MSKTYRILTVIAAVALLATGSFFIYRHFHSSSPALVEKQTKDVQSFFQGQKEQLVAVQHALSETEEKVVSFDEGFWILENGNRLWNDEVSGFLRDITKVKGKEYDRVAVYAANPTANTLFSVEIYYGENDMMYTIVYSEEDMPAQDDRYIELDTNWYLWITGMT